jgi:hypothetical protein
MASSGSRIIFSQISGFDDENKFSHRELYYLLYLNLSIAKSKELNINILFFFFRILLKLVQLRSNPIDLSLWRKTDLGILREAVIIKGI